MTLFSKIAKFVFPHPVGEKKTKSVSLIPPVGEKKTKSVSSPVIPKTVTEKLLEAENAKERSKILRSRGKELLDARKEWASAVDWRQFSQMHNGSLIHKSPFEGCYVGSSVKAWKKWLDCWESTKGRIINAKLNLTQLKAVKDALNDLDYFKNLFPPFSLFSTPEEGARAFRKALITSLQERDAVYLPIGYRGGVLNAGHAIMAKVIFNKEKKVVTFYLLNLGDGSQAHPVLNSTPSQDKISFRYFPIDVSLEQLEGDVGLTAFGHLIRYLSDPPDPDHLCYQGADIYEIFERLGTVRPDLGPEPERYEAKPQRFGNCAEKGVKNVVHDALIESGAPQKEIKKFFLNARLCSLIEGYHSFLQDQDPTDQQKAFLQNGILGFGSALLKLQSSLTREEFNDATALVRVMQSSIKKVEIKEPVKKSQPFPVPTKFPHSYPPVCQEQVEKIAAEKAQQAQAPAEQPVVQRDSFTPSFEIGSFTDQVKLWITKIEKLPETGRMDFLRQCTSILPLPEWGKEDVWDKFPQEQVAPLLKQFEQLLYLGLSAYTPQRNSFIEPMLALHTIYVISDKLARRCEDTKLKGFASPFTPLQYPLHPTDFTALPFGEENLRYSQISDYFTACSKAANYKVIFPVRPILPVEKYLYDNNADYQGYCHLQFLQQYIDPEASKQTSLYIQVWKDLCPSAVSSLYYFALLATDMLFRDTSALPKSLIFAQAKDEDGKEALSLQTNLQRDPKFIANDSLICQFFDMGTALIAELKDFGKKTTNEAVCARIDEAEARSLSIGEPVYRQLHRICVNNNLKASLALQWASTSSNFFFLENKQIQTLLTHCFFHPNDLSELLRNQPSFIEKLREWISKAVSYYENKKEQADTILFLIKTGLYFETFYITLYGADEKSNKQLFYYKSKLETVPQAENVQLLWVFGESLRQTKSDEEQIDFQKKLFSLKPESISWFSRRILLLAEKESEKLTLRLQKDAAFRNKLCNTILYSLLPEAGEAKWEGKFPIYSSGEYTLDFIARTLTKKGGGVFVSFPYDLPSEGTLARHVLQMHGGHTGGWHSQGKDTVSPDGKVRVSKSDGGNLSIEKNVLYKGTLRKGAFYQFSIAEIDKKNCSFLEYYPIIPYAHFILWDEKQEGRRIITYDTRTDTPCLETHYKGTDLVITRLDEKGEPLPCTLINLSLVKEINEPFYQYLLRFAAPEHILCFYHENSKTFDVNFYLLGMEFISKEGGLESQQFPGFYLKPEITLDELNGFSEAFILEKPTGEKKVIIPQYDLQTSPEEFSTKILVSKPRGEGQISFYSYDVDRYTGALISEDPAANLFLALILRLQRDEMRAWKYLKRAQTGIDGRHDLVTRFNRIHDHSSRGEAFNCKLLYLVVDSFNKMAEKRFERTPFSDCHENLIFQGTESYLRYLRILGHEDLSSIPKELRLALEEERAILRALKQYAEKSKRPLPEILENRYILLCLTKTQVDVSIHPKEVKISRSGYSTLISPNSFSSTLKINETTCPTFPYGDNRRKCAKVGENCDYPKYPNRISGEAVETHFIELYEAARKCLTDQIKPFDFTLMALLKVEERDKGEVDRRPLAHLLFYVRHYAERFTSLSFEKASDDKAKIAIFNQIVETVSSLSKEINEDTFQKKIQFDFSKKITLKVPLSPPPAAIKLSSETHEKRAFGSICDSLFSPKEHSAALSKDPPFLTTPSSTIKENVRKEIVEKFEGGYQELQGRAVHTYTLKEEEISAALKKLADRGQDLNNTLTKERKQLIALMNMPYKCRSGRLEKESDVDAEIESRLQHYSLQHKTLLPETVMQEMILRGDSSMLKKHSPLLTDKEIEQICTGVCAYYYHLVLHEQCKEALALLSQLQTTPSNVDLQAQLYSKLNYEFLDPQVYPEIYYFKIKEGKLPWKDQAELYEWVCEGIAKGETRLFQHKAGGGKTDYLTPLFMLRAKKERLLPVFMTTQMIYTVDKENLTSTMSKLDENLGFLEIGLHSHISAADYRFIYEQLIQYINEGRGLIITPQTYYALRLHYLNAGIKEKDEESVKYLSLILNFFENRALLLCDEAHQNLDPLTRAIFGVGEFTNLPKAERKLFLALLKPLLGFVNVNSSKGHDLSDLSKMKRNLPGIPNEEEIKELQEGLALYCSTLEMLHIPEKHRKEMIAYWTDKATSQPEYLRQLTSEKADLISLTGYFILDLLPRIVKMRTELDHAPSLFQEEEFDTPCHHKTPSAAQYEDTYLGTALSIKGTAHRGLSEPQMIKLLLRLIEKDQQEAAEKSTVETKSYALFKEMVKGSSLATRELKDLSLSKPEKVKQLHAVLSKNPLAIDAYLSHFILPQLGYALEQINATPAHLLNGFKRAVLFTATPMSKKVYPHAVKEVRYDSSFEAEVATQICNEKNKKALVVKSPETFFEEAKPYFDEISVFIDPAGFFSDFPNMEVAKKWLACSTLDGIFYFKEARSLQVDREERVSLLLRKDPEKPVELVGSNIEQALASRHLDWSSLKLGTYYDASHTESANIKQKPGAKALFFVADNLTSSRLIQAQMRMRGFLNDKMEQSTIWVYPKSVIKAISAEEKPDGPSLFAWTVSNEEEQLKRELILAAYQEIAYQIEAEARAELKEQLRKPAEQIQLMKKYERGFTEHNKHNPYEAYGDHESEEKTETVLKDYAEREYARYGYATPLLDNRSLLDTINTIIANLEAKIAKISTHTSNDLSFEVEQHTQKKVETKEKIKAETRMQQYYPRHDDPVAAVKINGKANILAPGFFETGIDIDQANQLLGIDGLSSDLFFEKNHQSTALHGSLALGLDFLKPIDFFLIGITESGEKKAVVFINEHLSTFLQQLREGTVDPAVTHRAFIVQADGTLIQRGKGRLNPTDKELKEILSSELKDLVIDAALLKGQVVHADRLFERMKKWEDFEAFWRKKVVKAQPNPETANRKAMEKLLEHLKNVVIDTKQEKKL